MIRPVTLLLALFSLSACSGNSNEDPAKAKADQIWKTRCVTCHGKNGAGDGPSASGLDPKPRTFKNQEWQKKTTDDRIKKVIVEGGAGVGLSASMAANPDLKDQPEVVAELVKMVRRMGS